MSRNSIDSTNSINSFDLFETIDVTLAECRGTLNAAIADIERAERLRGKLAAEFATLRAERDALEIYDEPAAAAILGLTAWTLGDMRRAAINAGQPFPHTALGKHIRYTREHLRQIVAMYEVGAKKKITKDELRITNLRAA